jgi:hypothetical protein
MLRRQRHGKNLCSWVAMPWPQELRGPITDAKNTSARGLREPSERCRSLPYRNNAITFDQLDPSAHAPRTRTPLVYEADCAFWYRRTPPRR